MTQRAMTFFVLLLVPILAQAQSWWNDQWAYRKSITVDTSATGANVPAEVDNLPVLVRLHTGNFGYFLDLAEDARDLRFMSDDDKTPLKFHIEKYDAVNQMALIWVNDPKLLAASSANRFWMYYGNQSAVAAQDAAATYDPNQALVYHFGTDQQAPHDSTGYGNNAAAWTGEPLKDSLIGAGARFNGNAQLRIANTPSLQVDPTKGWTVGFWFRVDSLPQAAQPLLLRSDDNGALALDLTPDGLVARLSVGDQVAQTPPVPFAPTNWHHVSLVLSADGLKLWLDGKQAQQLAAAVPALAGDILMGQLDPSTPGFVGDIDELEISSVARSDAWLAAVEAAQAPGTSMIAYGEDADQGSGGGESYFMITLHNVTVDGWVVIILLAIMSAISWVVMVGKGLVINRVRKENRAFEEDFAKLGTGHIADLDSGKSDRDRELDESPLMMALSGKHDHFQSSTLFPIYHAGVQEIRDRVAKSVGARAADTVLSAQAIDAIRATMDSVMTRQNQKLNGQMVLLTIAISGGPFLGLLGTVVGVMITFAVIAATGDVNVNSIAPGIAAALVATVAGLAVAIPALFGYNYLGTRIKDIQSDMRVFTDEFIAKTAEDYS